MRRYYKVGLVINLVPMGVFRFPSSRQGALFSLHKDFDFIAYIVIDSAARGASVGLSMVLALY